MDRENNALQVASYPGTEVPGGHNYPLRAGMVITRWGNNIEANTITWANPEYNAVIEKRDNGYFNTRQSSFFISCEDGNLVELMGVYKPMLEPSNYGTVLGKIPEGLLSTEAAKLINKDQPYLYARGIIVQDLIRIDYDGAVTRMSNYRGTWSAETAASETEYYRSTTGAYDTVTWNNCLWQCVASGTTDEPSEATGSWVNMSGGVEIPELRVWKIMPNTDIVTLRYDESGPKTTKVIIQEIRIKNIISSSHHITARVCKPQRVVEAVGITVVGLGVFRVLYHNIWREHPANKRVIHSAVHVNQAEVVVVFVYIL